ncbi:MAG: AMP-binding protein [Paludibacteraceae bacterium]|nr:AMP-binding protein [Paludibacteraceae bacterium]
MNYDTSTQLQRAIELLHTAKQAPYYAQKYAHITDIRTWDDWANVPTLERQELYDHTYPRSTDMFTGPLQDAFVSSTGGSSGTARTIVLSGEEWEVMNQHQAQAFAALHIRPTDIVANMFVAGHLWPSFIGAHEMIMRNHCVHLPISANIGVEEAYKLCREYRPTVMISLPTFFVLMADLAKKEGKTFDNLRMIAYVGEQLSREAEDYVRKWLGCTEVKPLAYTSGDCGIMGYQTDDCGFGEYHTLKDFQLIEIVNPDTMQPVGRGEKGEILVTSLCRKFHPIIRYRIGDMAMWLSEDKYRLCGRAGEDFKLGGAYITVGEFERVISRFDAFSLNFTIELTDIGGQMDLIISVECDAPDKHIAEARQLEDALAEQITDIGGGRKIGFFRTYEVRLLPLGALPRNPITGKIKKVIDHRTE